MIPSNKFHTSKTRRISLSVTDSFFNHLKGMIHELNWNQIWTGLARFGKPWATLGQTSNLPELTQVVTLDIWCITNVLFWKNLEKHLLHIGLNAQILDAGPCPAKHTSPACFFHGRSPFGKWCILTSKSHNENVLLLSFFSPQLLGGKREMESCISLAIKLELRHHIW